MSGLSFVLRRRVPLLRPVCGTSARDCHLAISINHRQGRTDFLLSAAASHRRSDNVSSSIGLGRRALSSQSNNNGTNDDNESSSRNLKSRPRKEDHWDDKKVTGYFGHNFPDFIEKWNRQRFRQVGYGLVASTSALALGSALIFESALPIAPTLFMGALTTAYWTVGLNDVSQKSHAVRRNYPVIGNLRYVMETIRPEIRQYLVEADTEGKPLDRMTRSLVYQRAKNVDDTLAFGTRRDVYAPRYEWACHSMFPKPPIPPDDATTWNSEQPRRRVWVGTPEFGTTRPYSASLLNVSAMSYGAISDNAILALSAGAKMGHFYHNTGEGGVSLSHRKGGGSLVWNVGTGYFGCGITLPDGKRVFNDELFQETIHENPTIRMIEIKLSQGAKPGHGALELTEYNVSPTITGIVSHTNNYLLRSTTWTSRGTGGILPLSKITPEIAAARKLTYPATSDCHSPSNHSAFNDHVGLIKFIMRLRELSGGLPVGIKLCVGDPRDIACLVHAMVEMGNGPDFFTVDGGEGGTGAAPPEYSNSIGLPLEEGLAVVRNFLAGAGIRDKVRIIASGKVTSGFSLVRTLALGADLTCAARAFMLSLGCIQAQKCNTNKCPTGIATQNKELQFGLDPTDKSFRVYNFHRKTMDAAAEIIGTIGHNHFSSISANDIMRRHTEREVMTLEHYLPTVETESLLRGNGPKPLQELWDGTAKGGKRGAIRWIY